MWTYEYKKGTRANQEELGGALHEEENRHPNSPQRGLEWFGPQSTELAPSRPSITLIDRNISNFMFSHFYFLLTPAPLN